MDLFKSTFFRMSESPPPAIHHPSKERPSPIDIPEILERVFYFTDDFTLRMTAILVCRQWFHININRFPRTVYYKNDMRRKQPGLVVSRLIGAPRLHCYLTVDDMSRNIRNPFTSNIRNVIVNSQLGYQKLLEKQNQIATHKHKPAIHSFSPLREMVLDIAHYISGSFDTFPFPETLTNVTLRIHSSDGGSINIDRILGQCPLLESLSIETRMRDHNCLTWEEPMTLQRDLALRSFTLNHITLQYTKLLHILSSAPQLKVLKLIGMISSGHDLSLLCSHIKTLSLDLETFHFSTYDKTLTQDLQQQALEIYPVTAEWNLWASDVSPLLLKQLEVHKPCLTTLELQWQRKGNITEYERYVRSCDIAKASRLLFGYLCNSPFAANLRSLKTGVLYQDMDVFGRGQPFDTSLSPAPQAPWTSPGIWRCRNLRVLHINLRDPISSMKRQVQSRIVFGYIAKVAPHLEDLEIYFPYFIVNRAPDHIYAAKLCMQLEGGFCLLGRLRYLQRLRVYALGGRITGLCQEMDLNWIIPSGRSDKFKELRQQEIASWQSLRLVEDQCNQAQQQQDDGDGSGDKDGSLDAEVRNQFRNLGLLMDVEEAINEFDGGSLVPFPSLTGLSFVHPILQGPEKALNQLFPSPSLSSAFEPSPPTHTQWPSRSTAQALNLPELLSQIFSYLDDRTLIQNVTLVCRQWYYVLQNTIPRSVVWDRCSRSQTRLATVPLRLVGAARLFCYLEKDSDSNTHDAVAKIFANSQEQYRKQVEMKETGRAVGSAAANRKKGVPDLTTKSTTATTLRRFSPLQELHFIIDNISEQAIYNTFPYPSTLTKFVLKVDCWKFNVVIPFANILRNCPHLEHFEAHDTPDLSLLWTPEVADYHQHQYPLALRTFILYNTKIPQASLETLLAATPKLKVLKVIGMSWYNMPYNWTRLLDHLLSLPISLDAIHLSSLTEPMSDDISHRILDTCTSALSEWNLLAHDISTQLLKDMEIYTDRLTTLEVYSQPPACRRSIRDHYCQYDLRNAPAVLHVFLTSPENENTLLHLRTLKTIARLEDFDIHHREGYILPENPHRRIRPPETCAPAGPPRIWRCQGLRALHVEIHGLGDYHLKNPAHSRIIFGYISRVFPLLEELQVQMPRECIVQRKIRNYSPKLCLQLEGGLCLLSRLRYLERLRLIWNRTSSSSSSGINFEESDMNWMVPSGRKRKCAERRREKVKARSWQCQRIQEDVSETRRLRREQRQRKGEEDIAISSNGNGDVVPANTEVLHLLRNLGLLSDVEEMIKEIDESKSFIPLPSLEGLSLGHHHFAHPESEIKRCCHLQTSAGAWKQLWTSKNA